MGNRKRSRIFFFYIYTVCSREEDLRQSDCILIIVMTHGLFNDHLYSKDTHYPSNDLRLLFLTKQCPSLAGKPKLFIFQVLYTYQMNQNIYFFKVNVFLHSSTGLQG